MSECLKLTDEDGSVLSVVYGEDNTVLLLKNSDLHANAEFILSPEDERRICKVFAGRKAKRWEYLRTLHSVPFREEQDDELAEIGRNGWEMVSVAVNDTDDDHAYAIYHFRREVSQ